MEQRLHIVIIFPNDDTREAVAFNSVLVHLNTNVFPGEGFSLLKQVEGYWLSPENEEWVRDYSTWFITDIPHPKNAADTARLLQGIRRFALNAYLEAGRPQDEIWVTSRPINRWGATGTKF